MLFTGNPTRSVSGTGGSSGKSWQRAIREQRYFQEELFAACKRHRTGPSHRDGCRLTDPQRGRLDRDRQGHLRCRARRADPQAQGRCQHRLARLPARQTAARSGCHPARQSGRSRKACLRRAGSEGRRRTVITARSGHGRQLRRLRWGVAFDFEPERERLVDEEAGGFGGETDGRPPRVPSAAACSSSQAHKRDDATDAHQFFSTLAPARAAFCLARFC